jgi:Lipid desaturase domain
MVKYQQHTLLDIASVILFGVMIVLLAKDLLAFNLSGYALLLAAFFGYIFADLISGIVHFMGDTIGSSTTPILGKMFITAFREHHEDQTDITRHNFFNTNGNNCLVSLPVMIFLHVFVANPAEQNHVIAFFFALGFFLVLGVFATNQIHKWAHTQHPPAYIRTLQKYNLILNPKHHAVHHTPPHTTYFCITTGWLNPLIEKTKLFHVVRKVYEKRR